MASLLTSTVKSAATEPLITGTLLYLLTRAPAHIRARVLTPLRGILLAKDGSSRLPTIIRLLKILTAVGVVRRMNQGLNALAWNNWALRRQGTAWRFGPGKEELVLITGGSSGFGYEMVKGFARVARVVVLDIQAFPEELAALPHVHFYRCDLTDTKAIEDVSKEVRQAYGDPSVLVNNAGIGIGKTVLDTSNAECQRLFQVNLISHFVLIREFLPGMLRNKKGHIVTIASMASFIAAPGLLDYCISKVGALYLSEGIRAECLTRYPGGEGICTTSIHPSWHRTGIIKGAEKALEKHGVRIDPPTNVSNAVVEQVLAGRSGRVVVPRSEEGKTGVRNWPRWAQDVLYGYVLKRKDQFGLGTGPETTLDYVK